MRKSTLLGLLSLGFSASILACSGGTTVTTDPGVALTYEAPLLLGCSNATVDVGDVDGDGHGDLVAVCKSGSSYTARVYLASTGSFGEPIVSTVNDSGGYLFDVDGDGLVDYVTYGSFFTATGDGHFSAAKKAIIPQGERRFDVDGDGFLDILSWDAGKLTAYSLLADGSALIIYQVVDVDKNPSFADLDGDGKLDMFYAMGSAVVARFGKGAGAFSPARAILTADVPITGVRAVEIDGDGHPDLVLSIGSTSLIYGYALMRNSGAATFTQVKNIAAGSSTGVSFQDATGDGRMDVGILDDERVAVAPGTGSGTFLDATLITGPWSDASGLVFADVNADGKLDLVVPRGSVSVLLRK